jgi:hypothetical protein
MIDDRSKRGAWLLKQAKHPGQGWLMILLILQNAYCFGNVRIAIFCTKTTMWSWCNEGCYSPNVSRDGNNEVCVGETL